MGLSKEKEALYIEKLKENGMFLKQIPIHEQTEDICLAAVKENGWALEYVHHQTPEICLEAVKENGWALKFVKEQTEEICLTAVKRSGWALEYVKNKTKNLCLEAIRRNGPAIRFVPEQTPDLCWEAIQQDPTTLGMIQKPTQKLCLEAVKKNAMVLESVRTFELFSSMFDELGLIASFQAYQPHLASHLWTQEMDEIKQFIHQAWNDETVSYQNIRLQLALGQLKLNQSPYHVLEHLS